jgi:glycosyltransferase involved in cell wall biosynthesis
MMEVPDAAARPQPSGRLFTVGIPVFNGKSLLRNCLQSVINSRLPRDRFEIVIADDGSSEPETLAIIDEFEKSLAANAGFFRVISLGTNSGGAARPRNCILDEATGEYVFFIDSDDTIGNLALERIAEAVAATPADWVALNQVPVNGRVGVCTVRQPHAEVPRAKATRRNPPTSQGAQTLQRHSSRRMSGSCARCSRPCGRAPFPNPNAGRSSPT